MRGPTITVIHPTRGRPEQALETRRRWMQRALDSTGRDLRWLWLLDEGDPCLEDYEKAISTGDLGTAIVENNRCMVDAVNTALPSLPEEGPVIMATDDMLPSETWDAFLACEWRLGRLLYVKVDAPIQTTICGCASVFHRWGYLYYPGFISMYADNDYTEHGEAEGICDRTRNIVMEHHHPSTGGVETDPTYERQNHRASYRHGELVLQRRRWTGYA